MLLLLFLPAFVAEVVSGATPPAVFFTQPNILIGFCLYYGSAAILAREFALRWGRGWPGVVVLGAAFAVIQEGLGTKVFFDTTRTTLSPLVNYGTAGGVHWAFVVQLIIYHAIFSVSVPVLLVELTFRERRHERWVGGRGLVLALVCLLLETWLLYLVYPFVPPAGPYLATVIGAVGLILFARRAPRQCGVPADQAHVWRPRTFWAVGMLVTTLFMLVSFGAPSANIPPPITALLMIALATLSVRQIVTRSGGGQAWSDEHQLALPAGLLMPWIVLSFFKETTGSTGSSLVGLVMLGYLFWLSRRLRARPTAAPAVVPSPLNLPG